jgi:hypothetical protein
MAPGDCSGILALVTSIMYSLRFAPGPTCRGSASLYVPPLNYKREGTRRYKGDSQVHSYAEAHRLNTRRQWSRVLHSSGLNHSKPLCVLCVHPESTQQAKRLGPLLILGFRAGAFRHPARDFPLRHLARQVGGLGIRFLPVFLLDTMVQIVEHHDFIPDDFPMEEEATSSMPQAFNRPAPGAAVVHSARQHTPTQTSRASRAAPGALSVARESLHHPPSSTASPGAMKQWHDDVDRLLGMAHYGSARPRPRSSRRQHEASASVRSPSVRAAPTEDLRAELNRRRAGEDTPVSLERPDDLWVELNRRRAGEDARVSLERASERRQNVEGHNLDLDFSAVAPQTPRGARIQAGVSLAGVGCAALADHLYAATWPSKFRPYLPKKYDGTSNPSEFLQVYVIAITAAGGDTAVMATYFHVALSGPARTWLMNLTPGSIYSWEELCARFTANFASAYQHHGVEAHLHAVRQESGKTLRAFISRFTKVRGTIPRISDASIITAFR